MPTLTDDIPATDTQALNDRRQELIERFLADDRVDFLKQNALLLDEYFQNAFMNSRVGPRMEISRNPYAVIALGGYGRSEQCIHSDIDLLVLFEKKIPAQADALIREMIYPLWDIGMEVGYATRSLKECLQLAASDYDILTPILDARFICGMSPLFSALTHKLHEGVIKRKSVKIIHWLVEKNRERHLHFGDSAYLLEPNLKEGQGGLRDYHTILWIARIKHQLKTPRDLEYLGQMSHEEYRELRTALGFIWRTRNWLHYQRGRKRDQLRFPDQPALAAALRYDEADGRQPVERFMGDLHANMEYVKQQHLVYLYENWLEKPHRRKRSTRKQPREDRLEITPRGRLNFRSPEAIANQPALLMHSFEESARLRLPLSLEAKRLVREFSHLVDNAYRSDPKMVSAFENILVAPAATFNVLGEMLLTGFLSQFIPEFARLENRIQYDEYHLYPVGRHSLQAVQTLKEFAIDKADEAPALYNRVYRELHRKKLLLWAVLLHDIGKGDVETGHAGRGEVIAREIMARHGYSQKDIDLVAYLVHDHLFLIETATRRDIQDEETAIFCARRIKTAQRLKMLYLLTVADSMATGPAAWSDWTANLLRELFLKTLNVIENGELASAAAIAIVDRKREQVTRLAKEGTPGVDCERLLEAMSPRYLLLTPASDIFEHVALFESLSAPAEFVWNVAPSADGSTRTVTICAVDRPGLISKMAGVFTLNSINILDVQVFTWKNQVALDIFTVTPPPDAIFEKEKWQKTRAQLSAALAGELELGAALEKRLSVKKQTGPKGLIRPHSVKVDNNTSSFFTIVEVYTYDFPGLLYAVTDALFRCGLDIWVAKIATKVDQVVDVFYVRDENGQKVDAPEEVRRIENAILERLPDLARTA
jgi:[protein-PII] uridylyltransferase